MTIWAVFAAPAKAAELAVLDQQDFDLLQEIVDPMRLPCTFRLTGQIETGDAERIGAEIESALAKLHGQAPWVSPVLCLDSPGGSLSDALALAETLREHFIGTRLEAGRDCLSACALLFLAGTYNAGDFGVFTWRIMHPTARLGFHAPSLIVPDQSYDKAQVESAYHLALQSIALAVDTNMLPTQDAESPPAMPASLLSAMLRTPSDQMLYIDTVDKAGRWHIAVGPINLPDLEIGIDRLVNACHNLSAWETHESGFTRIGWGYASLEVDGTDWDFGRNQEVERYHVLIQGHAPRGCLFHLPIGARERGKVRLKDLGYPDQTSLYHGGFPWLSVMPPGTPLIGFR